MLKKILATTAMATLLGTGAYAQTEPAAPAAPAAPEAPATDTMDGDATAPVPEVVQETPPAGTDAPAVADDAMTDPAQEMTPVDLASVSAEDLIGSDIVTFDNEKAATVSDVVMDDAGAVEGVVAQFGGFLGFGANEVVLTLDELEVMRDGNDTTVIRTSVTPEMIEERPPYEG